MVSSDYVLCNASNTISLDSLFAFQRLYMKSVPGEIRTYLLHVAFGNLGRLGQQQFPIII